MSLPKPLPTEIDEALSESHSLSYPEDEVPFYLFGSTKALSITLWLLSGLALFTWGYNPNWVMLKPYHSVKSGMLHLGLFVLTAVFFQKTILLHLHSQKEESVPVTVGTKVLLLLWCLSVWVSLGILPGHLGIIFGSALLLIGLSRLALGKIRASQSAASVEQKVFLTPLELCSLALLLVGVILLIHFYGLLFVVVAPLVALLGSVAWVLKHRRTKVPALWYVGCVLVTALPWATTYQAYRGYVVYSEKQRGHLLAAEYAPLWNDEMRIKLLDPYDHPSIQKPLVRVLVRMWLTGRFGMSAEAKLVRYLSHYKDTSKLWLEHLKQNPATQTPSIDRSLQLLQYARITKDIRTLSKIRASNCFESLYKHFPQHRKSMAKKLLKSFFTHPACHRAPCSQRQVTKMRKDWLKTFFNKGSAGQYSYGNALLMDALGIRVVLLYRQTPALVQKLLIQELDFVTKQASTASALHARLLLYAMLKFDTFALRKPKSPTDKKHVRQSLKNIILADLRAKSIERQLLGSIILARSCHYYSSLFTRPTCIQLGLQVPKKVRAYIERYKSDDNVKTIAKTLEQIGRAPLQVLELPKTPSDRR